MRGMQGVRVQRRLVFEAHDAAERVAFSPGREILSRVRLKQPGNLALKTSNNRRRSFFLVFCSARLPLERKDMNLYPAVSRAKSLER
jgi:hypothetical protein